MEKELSDAEQNERKNPCHNKKQLANNLRADEKEKLEWR